MRAEEKGGESHSDYKGIPIPVVKKRGQTWQWKQTHNEAFVPKLLGSHTRNRGTWVGGDWLGQGKSKRLMFVKRKQNWFVCFKKGWEDKSKKKKKQPAIVESTHSLLKCSKTQTEIYNQHLQALSMKQKTLKCPEAASAVPEKQLWDCTGLWSEPFSFNKFVTAESATELGIADHRKAPAHCNFQL